MEIAPWSFLIYGQMDCSSFDTIPSVMAMELKQSRFDGLFEILKGNFPMEMVKIVIWIQRC